MVIVLGCLRVDGWVSLGIRSLWRNTNHVSGATVTRDAGLRSMGSLPGTKSLLDICCV